MHIDWCDEPEIVVRHDFHGIFSYISIVQFSFNEEI